MLLGPLACHRDQLLLSAAVGSSSLQQSLMPWHQPGGKSVPLLSRMVKPSEHIGCCVMAGMALLAVAAWEGYQGSMVSQLSGVSGCQGSLLCDRVGAPVHMTDNIAGNNHKVEVPRQCLEDEAPASESALLETAWRLFHKSSSLAINLADYILLSLKGLLRQDLWSRAAGGAFNMSAEHFWSAM